MADMSVSLLARSIIKVVTPEGEEVSDPNEIFAFVQNVDSKAVKLIDEVLAKINSLNIDKRVELECSVDTCKNVWTTEIEFNPADFFAVGS